MALGDWPKMAARTASFAAGRGTTTRATCALRTATGTTRRTATTTLDFAVPELTRGLDGPCLNRSVFAAFFRVRQNAVAAGVLVAMLDDIANAHRPVPTGCAPNSVRIRLRPGASRLGAAVRSLVAHTVARP